MTIEAPLLATSASKITTIDNLLAHASQIPQIPLTTQTALESAIKIDNWTDPMIRRVYRQLTQPVEEEAVDAIGLVNSQIITELKTLVRQSDASEMDQQVVNERLDELSLYSALELNVAGNNYLANLLVHVKSQEVRERRLGSSKNRTLVQAVLELFALQSGESFWNLNDEAVDRDILDTVEGIRAGQPILKDSFYSPRSGIVGETNAARPLRLIYFYGEKIGPAEREFLAKLALKNDYRAAEHKLLRDILTPQQILETFNLQDPLLNAKLTMLKKSLPKTDLKIINTEIYRQLNEYINQTLQSADTDRETIDAVIRKLSWDNFAFLRQTPKSPHQIKSLSANLFLLELRALEYGTQALTGETFNTFLKCIGSPGFDPEMGVLGRSIAYLKHRISNPVIAALFQKQIEDFSGDELLQSRETEFLSTEAFAKTLAFSLRTTTNVKYNSVVEWLRQSSLTRLGIGESLPALFDYFNKNSRVRHQLYELAASPNDVNKNYFITDLLKSATPLISSLLTSTTNKQVLGEFLSNMRTLSDLVGGDEELAQQHLSRLTHLFSDANATILDFNLGLNSSIDEVFKSIFQIQDNPNEAGIHEADAHQVNIVSRLRERLGENISFIFTALARYKKTPELIPLLGRCINSYLNGMYREQKFQKDAQLDFMTDEELEKWVNDYSSVKVVRANHEQILEEVMQTKEEAPTQFWQQALNDGHYQSAAKGISNPKFKQLCDSLVSSCSPATGLDPVPREQRQEEILKLAIQIRNDYHAKLLRTDFGNDLGRLIKSLQTKPAEVEDYVLFTTSSSSLRMCLDIGDVVFAMSCQSLQHGFIPETTLANALDGNVKVVASFKLKLSQLSKDKQEAAQILAQLESGELELMFDHDKFIFHIVRKTSEGTAANVIAEISADGKGVARRIVRVGKELDQNKAGVTYERLYSLGKQAAAEEQIMQIIKQHGKLAKGTVKILASRSPQGQYSDLGGGQKTYSYFVDLELIS